MSAPTPGPGATVVVTGASGNIGTSVLDVLDADERVGEIRALARRVPSRPGPWHKVRWRAADIADDDLVEPLQGADVVVHLAWMIQPSWDVDAMELANVAGSRRVFEAAVAAGVGAIVHASSLGAYAPGPKERPVDESWPLGGHAHHPYSRQKARVEFLLDGLERRHPDLRIVRVRPALVMKPGAARELRRYFLPRHVPGVLLRPALVDRLPTRFQVCHSDDVARAFAEAALRPVRGAYNLATTDVVGGRPRRLVEPPARAAVSLAWRLHLQPLDPGWMRLVFRSPLLAADRARRELDWEPRHRGHDVLAATLASMAEPPEPATPALRG